MNGTVKKAIEKLVSVAGLLKPFVLDAGFCVLLVENFLLNVLKNQMNELWKEEIIL